MDFVSCVMCNSKCSICGYENHQDILTRRNVPAHQNLLLNSHHDALHVVTGDLDLKICRNCAFIYNHSFDYSKLSYGPEYNSMQHISPSYVQYEDHLISHLLNNVGLKNSTIVEIGCGKGEFIRKLIHLGNGNTGYGIDDSYEGNLNPIDNLHFERSYLGESTEHILYQADVIICRHVIEHLDDPLKFLQLIKSQLDPNKNVNLFFEVPCAEFIFDNVNFWDLFYEHSSYYTTLSLRNLFYYAGFAVQYASRMQQWPYLWLEASTLYIENPTFSPAPDSLFKLISSYLIEESALMNSWEQRITSVSRYGKIAFWGAGAKGVTFVNTLQCVSQSIDCLIDSNHYKQNKFLPYSGHPVVSALTAVERGVKFAILLNPAYYDEVSLYLQRNSLPIEVILPIIN